MPSITLTVERQANRQAVRPLREPAAPSGPLGWMRSLAPLQVGHRLHLNTCSTLPSTWPVFSAKTRGDEPCVGSWRMVAGQERVEARVGGLQRRWRLLTHTHTHTHTQTEWSTHIKLVFLLHCSSLPCRHHRKCTYATLIALYRQAACTQWISMHV